MAKRGIKNKELRIKHKSRTSFFRGLLQLLVMIPVVLFCILSVVSWNLPQAEATAGINRTINFQGKLVNKSDGTNIGDGTYSFTFKLFDASSGGNQVWSETQSSVTVTNGIFQVALGSTTAFNAGGNNVLFSNNPLYLDVTFNSETFATRVQLTAAPYAINSEQLDGIVATQSATGFNLAGGTSTDSNIAFTTSGTTLTMQPGNAGILVISSNGTNGLTVDTGGAAQLSLGTANANAIVLGNNTNNTAITLGGTTSTGTITLGQSTGTNTISIGSAIVASGNTQTISVGNGAGAGTALNVNILDGVGTAGTASLLMANNTRVTAIDIGNIAAAAARTINLGTGSNTVAIDTINIGTGATTVAGGKTIHIGDGTPTGSGTNLVTIGSNAALANVTTIQGGNGTGASAGIQIIGAAAGDILIGGTGQTGTITLGQSTATNIINIGNAAQTGTQTINIGTGSTGAGLDVLTIGSTNGTSSLAIKSGSGNITIGSNATNGNVQISPNAGGQAALIVNKQSAAGDVFTASASGQSLFRITNNGGFMFQDSILVATGSGGVGNGSNAGVNALGDEGSLVPNAGFESAISSAWGDGWFPAATTSAGLFTRDTSTPAKGSAALLATITNSTAAIYSVCIPVSGVSGVYALNFYSKVSNVKMTIAAFVDGYTSKANCQGDTSPTLAVASSAAPTTSWTRLGTGVNAVGSFGATATWARIHFLFSCTSTCTAITGEVDGVRFIEKDGGQGLDYAENYPANPQNIPQPGDVVAIDMATNAPLAQVVPANKDMDPSMLGVVSTNPGQVLDDGSMTGSKVPVALAGRVPVKVNTANGNIAIGDYLTSSTTPGVAVKAISPGSTIGIAMQSYSGNGIGNITAFINKSYFAGVNNTGLSGQGIGLTQLIGTSSSGMNLSVENNKLVVKGSDGSDVITFDQNGNATFAGVLTAKEIRADKISGIDILTNEISALQDKFATESAVATENAVLGVNTLATPSGQLTLDSLSVTGLATVSADFRVRGDALFEDMVHVVNTLMTNNFIVNGIADFFGNVTFHNHLSVDKDTAGTTTIANGKNVTTVTFSKPYDSVPVVSATLHLDESTATNSAIFENNFFQENYSYVISSQSATGFTILLNKPAKQDVTFTWTAIGRNL